jgi:hypothetical protein
MVTGVLTVVALLLGYAVLPADKSIFTTAAAAGAMFHAHGWSGYLLFPAERATMAALPTRAYALPA